MAKYFCTILNKLGITQCSPFIIYKDNTAISMIANANKPNRRTSHIKISYFALQEWLQVGKLNLAHIRGVANTADALTEALGWTLHHCNVMQMMGHVGNVYNHMSGEI
eukprot:4921916-Ditylum_brightwellii.AAC.2